MERGRQRDRRETEKEKWSVEGSIFLWWGGSWAAHWYDSLIFWALLWSSLRGHPSIIRPVTSSLSSSSAFTLHMCLCDSKLCMCGSKYMCFSPCAHVCLSESDAPLSFQSRITCRGMWSWSSCYPGNTPRQPTGIETYQASTPRHSTQQRTGYMQCVCAYVCVSLNNHSCCQQLLRIQLRTLPGII